MLYEKCLNCEKLGTSCNCMSFVKMSSHEIIEWCKKKKTLLHITNEALANMSGVPVGTINRIFAGKGSDYYYETLRPIIKALVSGDWAEDNCPNIEETEEIKERSKDIIARLEQERDFLKQEIINVRQQAQKEIALLMPLLRFRKHTIIVLGSLLGVALALILTALIIDSLNPNVGFFFW